MSAPMPKSSTQKQAKSPADSMGGVSPPTCKGARSGPFACQRIPTLLACFYSATLAWNLSAVDTARLCPRQEGIRPVKRQTPETLKLGAAARLCACAVLANSAHSIMMKMQTTTMMGVRDVTLSEERMYSSSIAP